ncbi:MAG: DUF4365 domain-containing protein [Microbacterium sp.]|nr:DUF4365 domain-containing protein [Microbacterium sp.]
MIREYPKTPGNMRTAVLGSLRVQLEFAKLGIVCFEWPQSMDSGIDLVAFATFAETHDVKLRATAFTAGVQVKGTAVAFSDASSRKIYINQHSDYWQTATMPVFLVSVSITTDVVLIEDAWSLLTAQRHMDLQEKTSTSIPASVPLALVGDHIRLRMMSHALAPHLSSRIRSRPLSDVLLPEHDLAESVWTAFATSADPHYSYPNPRSWGEAQQHFELLAHMLRDASMKQNFSTEIERIRDAYSADTQTTESSPLDWESDGDSQIDLPPGILGAPTVVTGAVEVLCRLGELLTDRPIGSFRGVPELRDDDPALALEATRYPERRHQRLVVEAAIDVVAELWFLLCNTLDSDGVDAVEFLERSSRSTKLDGTSRSPRLVAESLIQSLGDIRETSEVVRTLRLFFRDTFEHDFESRHWERKLVVQTSSEE